MLGAASSAHQSELSIHQPSRPNTRVKHYQAYFKGAANRAHTCIDDLTWALLDIGNPCRVQPAGAHLQPEDKTSHFKLSGAAASAHRQ